MLELSLKIKMCKFINVKHGIALGLQELQSCLNHGKVTQFEYFLHAVFANKLPFVDYKIFAITIFVLN